MKSFKICRNTYRTAYRNIGFQTRELPAIKSPCTMSVVAPPRSAIALGAPGPAHAWWDFSLAVIGVLAMKLRVKAVHL